MPTVPQANLKPAQPISKSLPPRSTTGRALMLTTALVLAIVGGAALSGVATGGLQDVLRMTGIGRGGDIEAQAEDQQRQQAAVLAELERMLFTVSGEVASLNARIDETTRPVSNLRDQFARLDTDLGNLRGQVAAVRIDQARSYTSSIRGAPTDIEAALKSARSDIDGIRAGIDGRDEFQHKMFETIGRRLDRLEGATPSETTASVRKRPVKPVKRPVMARVPVENSWDRPPSNQNRF
jgi:hypothetical protein